MNTNLAYREEPREELIDGKVVAMSPAATNHNRIAGMIYHTFQSYLKGKKCVPFPDGETVFLSDDNHFVPDAMIVCDRDKIKRNGIYGAPDLVVEVLSPATARNDKGHKKSVYESNGVPEYWIADPVHKSIEVYLLRDGRYTLDNLYALHSEEELEDMTEKERAAVVTEFKCHLYNDLVIRLDDIFGDLF